MTDYPPSWRVATVQEVCTDIRNGMTYRNSAGAGGLPISRIETIANWRIDSHRVGYAGLAEVENKFLLQAGDVLFSHINSLPHLGKVALVEEVDLPLVHGMNLLRLRPAEFVLSKWLRLALESPQFRDQVQMYARHAVNQASINIRNLSKLVVALPPIEEQEEIVRILDTQLARLDTVLGSVQEVRGNAEQFRRSLLHAAFTGQLTQPDLEREGAPSDWEALTIADSLEASIGGVWGAEAGTDEADVDVIRVTELKSHGRIDPSTAARRSITFKQLASRELQEGDLLLEKSGGGPKTPVGRVGLVPQLERQSVCANFMMLMRADRTRVEPRLLHLLLNHLHQEGATVSLQKATTNIRNLKTKEYLQLEIHLPNVHEQPRLLHELETQLARLDKTLEVADGVEIECGRLRRSLLQAAFSGELTRKWREANG